MRSKGTEIPSPAAEWCIKMYAIYNLQSSIQFLVQITEHDENMNDEFYMNEDTSRVENELSWAARLTFIQFCHFTSRDFMGI